MTAFRNMMLGALSELDRVGNDLTEMGYNDLGERVHSALEDLLKSDGMIKSRPSKDIEVDPEVESK